MRFALSAIILAALFGSTNSPTHAEELSDAKFNELHKKLQPAKGEPWLTIPWRIALLDAQKTAAKEGKPIFIWAMDGHPLGCT
jgi:hypothetical protein